MARRVARLQGLPFKQPLYRATSSKQRGENRENRQLQASKAFASRGALDPEAIYLLVDDVITTGATLRYAAKALVDAGAREIWVGVIARQPLD